MDKFKNRCEAGRGLANLFMNYANDPNVNVLALPRGGVPVANEIAKALSVPLDIFTLRKLGVPGYEKLAMDAIVSDGITLFKEDINRRFQISFLYI